MSEHRGLLLFATLPAICVAALFEVCLGHRHDYTGHFLMQVDRLVFRSVGVGDRLRKAKWSRQLNMGLRVLNLEWSRDSRGMFIAMPATLMVLTITSILVWRASSV